MQSKESPFDTMTKGPVRMQPPAHPLAPLWLSLSGQAVLVPLQALQDLGPSLSLSRAVLAVSLSRVPYGQFLLAAAGAGIPLASLLRKRSETMHLFHRPLSSTYYSYLRRTGRYAGPRSVRSFFFFSSSLSLALAGALCHPYFRWRWNTSY